MKAQLVPTLSPAITRNGKIFSLLSMNGNNVRLIQNCEKFLFCVHFVSSFAKFSNHTILHPMLSWRSALSSSSVYSRNLSLSITSANKSETNQILIASLDFLKTHFQFHYWGQLHITWNIFFQTTTGNIISHFQSYNSQPAFILPAVPATVVNW